MKPQPKVKVWSSAVADKKFSAFIRSRDRVCVLCRRRPPEVVLTCSHYWGRYASSTRYDPQNCDALCYGCHFKVENAKQGEYKEFKEKQLGKKAYDDLRRRYYQGKTTRREAILKFMEVASLGDEGRG